MIIQRSHRPRGANGFSAAFVEQLRDRDIPRWRRFLREVIDPRFGSGAR